MLWSDVLAVGGPPSLVHLMIGAGAGLFLVGLFVLNPRWAMLGLAAFAAFITIKEFFYDVSQLGQSIAGAQVDAIMYGVGGLVGVAGGLTLPRTVSMGLGLVLVIIGLGIVAYFTVNGIEI